MVDIKANILRASKPWTLFKLTDNVLTTNRIRQKVESIGARMRATERIRRVFGKAANIITIKKR